MAKKRRQVKPKVAGVVQAPEKNSEIAPVLPKALSPEPKEPEVLPEPEQPVNVQSLSKEEKIENDQKNESSDDSSSSSDSDDSSSDSDSDSSDSDSKSASKEPLNPEPNQLTATPSALLATNFKVAPPQQYTSAATRSSSSDSYHSDTEEEDKKRRKKQKNLQRQIKTKVPKRSRSQRSVHCEMEEDEGLNTPYDDIPDWPESDFGELLRRIEEQLPAKDNLKFDSRAAKLDWNVVQFNDYTASDCYDVWSRISKRIRRFRTLSEMISDARDWVTKPWTNFYRGNKKNRHPDMPSRPLSTYMIYYLEQKDRVAGENPGLEMTQVSKIISEQYKLLDEAEKDKYTVRAAKERQNFEEKMVEFYRDHPELVPQPHVKPHARDNVKGPRRPSAPYKLFYQEQVKKYSSEGVFDRKAIEELTKKKWKDMGDKKKLVWITWALEDLKRYEMEVRTYQLEHPDFIPPSSAKNVLNKDERCIKERLSGKPLKPPNSAYSYFSRMMLQSDEDVKQIPPKLRMAEISRKWKEISDSQKTRYEEKVRELQEQYKLEFASYLEGLSKEEREEELKKSHPKRKSPLASVKPETEPVKPSRRVPPRAASRNNRRREPPAAQLYKDEPVPPPVRVYDLFLQKFLSEKPAGTTESQRKKEAPKYWQILPDAKREVYRKILVDLKEKYIKDYELFLKELSPEELKEFSLLKAKNKKLEDDDDDDDDLSRCNGGGSETNEESDSSSGSGGSDNDPESSSSGSPSDA